MTEPSPATDLSAAAQAPGWTGSAFGIRLHADFKALGLLEERETQSCEVGSDDGVGRRCRLRLVCEPALDATWPAQERTTVHEVRASDGRTVLAVHEHPQAGYRLDASYYGSFVVARDGREVLCAPTPIADWSWQAFLVGQILPLLAVLQGLEAMHGSAVAYGQDAIGLVADSRGGKSSLAVNLVRRGAAFVADDVLALEPDGARTTLQPGPALASVRHAEAQAIGARGLGEIGTVVGHDEHELRVVVPQQPRALKLAALYFLERADQEPSRVIEPIEPDPLLLLGASYNGFVRTRTRLVGQLDLYAHVARSVPTFRAVVWPGIDAHGLAGRIREHALDAIASAA